MRSCAFADGFPATNLDGSPWPWNEEKPLGRRGALGRYDYEDDHGYDEYDEGEGYGGTGLDAVHAEDMCVLPLGGGRYRM